MATEQRHVIFNRKQRVKKTTELVVHINSYNSGATRMGCGWVGGRV